MELQSEHSRRRHRFPSLILGNCWIGRIDEKRHGLRRREQLVKDFERLWHYLPIQLGHARNITAGPAKARDEAELDRIAARLRRERRWSAGRANHSDPTTNKIVY